MLWIRKPDNTQYGATRIRKRFAWLPTSLDNPQHGYVWLQTYYTLEEYGYWAYVGADWLERYSSVDITFLEKCKKVASPFGPRWVSP